MPAASYPLAKVRGFWVVSLVESQTLTTVTLGDHQSRLWYSLSSCSLISEGHRPGSLPSRSPPKVGAKLTSGVRPQKSVVWTRVAPCRGRAQATRTSTREKRRLKGDRGACQGLELLSRQGQGLIPVFVVFSNQPHYRRLTHATTIGEDAQ